MKLLEKDWFKILLISVSAIGYLLLGYGIPRTNFPALISIFAALFLCSGLLLKSSIELKTALWVAVGFRLLLLFATPALSDDYFRFLWDGRLLFAGENPFLHLPRFYAENHFAGISGLNPELFSGLNSPNYYSVYPPVSQFVFWVAALINPENNLAGIVTMRAVIILAEIGSFWLLLKLLQSFKLPAKNALLYALNPLVILELTGNLHFEALVVSFTLLAFYFFHRNRYHFSAIALGFAICSKLVPLLILPFVFGRLGFRKGLFFCSLTGLTCLVLFLPFVSSELLAHFGSSLNLYFQKFEFNASVYYVLRWLGFYFYGYNQIAKIGILLFVFTFLFILWLAFREKEKAVATLPLRFLQSLTVYYLLATIVHPWYITTLVAMSALTNSRYAIIWSGLAVLSYAAYQTASYSENPWLIGLEYTGLAAAILIEKRYGKGLQNPERKPELAA